MFCPWPPSSTIAKNAGSYTYLKDNMGSVTDVADTSGNKVQHYIYSAFGELLGIQDAQANDVTASPPLNTSFTFTGREFDRESGLYYYRARYYDSANGRFLQKDPSPGVGGVPSTVANSYAYATNSPLNYGDPTGGSIFGDIFGDVMGGLVGAVLGPLGSLTGIVLAQTGTLSQSDLEKLLVIEGVVAIGVVTGGAIYAYAAPALSSGIASAGIIGSGASAALGGAIAGAAASFTAGMIGGGIFSATGVGSFQQGFLIGGLAGSLGAAFAATNPYFFKGVVQDTYFTTSTLAAAGRNGMAVYGIYNVLNTDHGSSNAFNNTPGLGSVAITIGQGLGVIPTF